VSPSFEDPKNPGPAERAGGTNATTDQELVMSTSFRSLAAVTLAAASFLPVTPARAQDAEAEASSSPLTVSGNVALVTDYRFRGVSLSGGDPAIQGGVTLTHDSGFYVGTWASSIDDGGSDFYGDMELDLFGGWSGKVSEGVGLDVGLLYYAYPTNAAGNDAEFFEPYANVTGELGPVSAKVGINYAWSQDALLNEDNVYLHTELSAGIPTTPITLSGHLGYNSGALSADYVTGASTDKTSWDWSIGASATVLGNLTLGVSYIGVEASATKALGASDGFTDDTVVGSLTVTF
jgi:uncharacterized protein (TIGR02001 family)